MSFLSVKSYAVAFHSLGTENNAERKTELLKDRPLFDVQLQIPCRILAFFSGLGEAIHFNAATSQRIFHFYSVAVGANAIRRNGMRARKRRRSQQAAPEARPFFVRPVHQAYGHRWPAVEF